MKKQILDDTADRFANVNNESLYAVVPLVDPRHRGKLFAENELLATIKLSETVIENLLAANPFDVHGPIEQAGEPRPTYSIYITH